MGGIQSSNNIKYIDLLSSRVLTNENILKRLHKRMLIEFHYKLKNDLI